MSSKRYPFNGPSMADQASIVYFWNSLAEAKAALRRSREKR